MDIGPARREVIVEPPQLPEPLRQPAEPERVKEPAPERREPEKEPVGV